MQYLNPVTLELCEFRIKIHEKFLRNSLEILKLALRLSQNSMPLFLQILLCFLMPYDYKNPKEITLNGSRKLVQSVLKDFALF